MIVIREWLALIFYCVALAALVSIFTEEQPMVSIATMLVSFVLAYWIWPSRRKQQREDQSQWLDLVEVIIEWPVEVILKALRAIFSHGGGLDI